jgi:hypothetical protein
MTDYLDVEVQGVPLVLLAINSQSSRRLQSLKGILMSSALMATTQMHALAPRGETGYIQSHIHQGPITYHPGGAGGGGSYEIVTGVMRGTSKHPLYVHEGTANLSDEQIASLNSHGVGGITGRIYARGNRQRITRTMRWMQAGSDHASIKPRQPVMTFQKRGEPRKFRPWVSGQRPQPFVYWAFAHAAVYAEGRLRAAADTRRIA